MRTKSFHLTFMMRAAMTLLMITLTAVNALAGYKVSISKVKFTLLPGDASGEPITYHVYDHYFGTSWNNGAGVPNGQFYIIPKKAELWFVIPDVPESFKAPKGMVINGFEGSLTPGTHIQVTSEENTLTAELDIDWSLVPDATFELSPKSYTLNGSSFFDIPITVTSLNMGKVLFKHYEYPRYFSISTINCMLTDNKGNTLKVYVQGKNNIDDNPYYIFGSENNISEYLVNGQNKTRTLMIYIDPDEYNLAVPGTYTGSLPLIFEWGTGGRRVSDNKTCSIALTVTVPDTGDFHNIAVTTDGHGTAKAGRTAGKEGSEVNLTVTPNPGYVFKEWNVVSGNVTITDNKFTMPASDVEAKAVFEPIIITFDPQGGTVSPTSTTTEEGLLTSFPMPTKEGWDFSGWYTEPDGGEWVNFRTTFEDHATIYAQWYQGSYYKVDLPDLVTITPYEVNTAVTVNLTELTFKPNSNGDTPLKIRMFFNKGTLTNQSDNTKTIPFLFNNNSLGNSGYNQVFLPFTEEGSTTVYIVIQSDTWNSADPGTYTGNLTCSYRWVYENNRASSIYDIGTFPVTVTIPPRYSVSTSILPVDGGTVTGGGIYSEESNVILTATPAEGFVFDNWTIDGDEVGTDTSYELVADKDHTVVANFKRTYTITALASPAEGGTVMGSGTYKEGTIVWLTETPNEGYRLVNWEFLGLNGGSEDICPALVDDNYTFVANYERVYALSGTNVRFYPEGSYEPITEATDGQKVIVSAYLENVPAGKYFTGNYSSNDVTLQAGEYDATFTMPTKAVTVDAVLADQEEYEVGLISNTTVEIPPSVFFQLGRFDDNLDTGKRFFDLNKDGTWDLELTNQNFDTFYVTKLAGGYATNCRFEFVETSPEEQYYAVSFKFSGGSTIMPGDANSDGKVNIADVVEMVNYINPETQPSARFNLLNADVNNDQDITQDDIDAVVNMILNH